MDKTDNAKMEKDVNWGIERVKFESRIMIELKRSKERCFKYRYRQR